MKYIIIVFCLAVLVGCNEDPGAPVGLTLTEKLPQPEVKIISPAKLDTVSGSFELKVEFKNCVGFQRAYVSINNRTYRYYYPSNPLVHYVDAKDLIHGKNYIYIGMFDHFEKEYSVSRNFYVK